MTLDFSDCQNCWNTLYVHFTLCQMTYFCPKIEFWRNLANHLIWIFAPKFNNSFDTKIQIDHFSSFSRICSFWTKNGTLDTLCRGECTWKDSIKGFWYANVFWPGFGFSAPLVFWEWRWQRIFPIHFYDEILFFSFKMHFWFKVVHFY